MQQTCYQIVDPSAATYLLEKILSHKCKLLELFPCECIHVKPTQLSLRLCCQCVEDKNINSSDYVSIPYLLQASSSTTFKSWKFLKIFGLFSLIFNRESQRLLKNRSLPKRSSYLLFWIVTKVFMIPFPRSPKSKSSQIQIITPRELRVNYLSINKYVAHSR